MMRFRNLSPAVQVLSVLVAVAVVSVTWQVVIGHRFVSKDAYEDNDDRVLQLRDFKKYGPEEHLDLVCNFGDLQKGEIKLVRALSAPSFHNGDMYDNYLLYLSNSKKEMSTEFPTWNVSFESTVSNHIAISFYDDGGVGLTKSSFNNDTKEYENLAPGTYNIQVSPIDGKPLDYDLAVHCQPLLDFEIDFVPIPCDPLSWVPDGPEPGPFDSPFGYSISTLEGNLQIDAGRLAIGAEGVGLAFDEPIQHLRLDFSGEVDPSMSIRFFPVDDTPFIEETFDLNDSSLIEKSFDTEISSAYIIPSEEGAYLRTVCFPFADFLE